MKSVLGKALGDFRNEKPRIGWLTNKTELSQVLSVSRALPNMFCTLADFDCYTRSRVIRSKVYALEQEQPLFLAARSEKSFIIMANTSKYLFASSYFH